MFKMLVLETKIIQKQNSCLSWFRYRTNVLQAKWFIVVSRRSKKARYTHLLVFILALFIYLFDFLEPDKNSVDKCNHKRDYTIL